MFWLRSRWKPHSWFCTKHLWVFWDFRLTQAQREWLCVAFLLIDSRWCETDQRKSDTELHSANCWTAAALHWIPLIALPSRRCWVHCLECRQRYWWLRPPPQGEKTGGENQAQQADKVIKRWQTRECEGRIVTEAIHFPGKDFHLLYFESLQSEGEDGPNKQFKNTILHCNNHKLSTILF